MSIETMTKIATYTVGAGGIASYTFSNIPQTYTDLKLVGSMRESGNNGGRAYFYGRVNGDTTASYTYRWMAGYDATYVSNTSTDVTSYLAGVDPDVASSANIFGSCEIYFTNYTSNNYKTIFSDAVTDNNTTTFWMNTNTTTVWKNTSPITSITVFAGTTSFVQNSTFTLYGIKAMRTAVPPKMYGGAVSYDGTYYYHTFTSSDTLTVLQPTLVDYLVVAGGGGGLDGGGGGGAGGVRCTVGSTGGTGSVESKISLNPLSYSITVGAGGSGSTSASSKGTNGNDSIFSIITSTGGGGGGSDTSPAGAGGGSGGGARGNRGSYSGGTGISNQGYAGGGGENGTDAGGGGGAGQVGAPGTASWISGVGGNGIQTSISGTATYYGGGGGGGDGGTAPGGAAGGLGGGGAGGGGTSTNPVAGTTNTGGGGGGGKGSSGLNGAAGGSGIVIIRYKP